MRPKVALPCCNLSAIFVYLDSICFQLQRALGIFHQFSGRVVAQLKRCRQLNAFVVLLAGLLAPPRRKDGTQQFSTCFFCVCAKFLIFVYEICILWVFSLIIWFEGPEMKAMRPL